MRERVRCVIVGVALLAVSQDVSAQSLAERVSAVPADQTVSFAFESAPGVCGARYRSGECVEGPVNVELERSAGRVVRALVHVGGERHAASGIDLGTVQPEDAVTFLLSDDVLLGAGERVASRAVMAAALANTESWPSLLRIARSQQTPAVRRAAVFWVAVAAGEKATEGLRSLIGDDSDEIEVRKQAVFALSRIRTGAAIDALIEIARSNTEPEIRRTAMFWLGQSGNPRVLAFFEEVLRG